MNGNSNLCKHPSIIIQEIHEVQTGLKKISSYCNGMKECQELLLTAIESVEGVFEMVRTISNE